MKGEIKMKKVISKIKYYHVIWFLFLLSVFVLLMIDVLNLFDRGVNSFVVFGKNIWIYFVFVFTGEYPGYGISGTFTNVSGNINEIIPVNFEVFFEKTLSTICLPFNGIMQKTFWSHTLNVLLSIFQMLSLFILLGFILYILFNQYFEMKEFNEKVMDKETRPKKIFMKIIKPFKRLYYFIKEKILIFKNWSKEHSYLIYILILMILIKTHILFILIETFSYLLGFIVTFDFVSLWNQITAIIYDLYPTFRILPIWMWMIIILILLGKHLINKADDELLHQQSILKLLVKTEFGSTNFIVGKPSAGKDLLGTELTLIAESTLRYDLKQVILEIRSEYPDFPFVSFEHQLQELIKKRKILNWTQAKNYIYKEWKKVSKKKDKEKILFFNYPIYQKKNTYYDELKVTNLIDSLADYAHAYFMYVQSGVLSASNYPIRFDNIRINKGHFINYDDNFVSHDNRYMEEYSSYSKINNYDWQRVYKKVNNDEFASLDDGVILTLSEYAKERGNQLDYRGLYKNEEVNQINDGTNSFWKTKSHINVIRGKRYGQAFINDQREDSLNADNKEVFEYIWTIENRSEPISVLSGFWYSRMILDFLNNMFKKFYIKLMNSRSDDSLLYYLIKKINCGLTTLQRRIHNRWDISMITIKNQYDEEIGVPLIHKLIYANRYNTSIYGPLYESIYQKNTIGFYESPEYQDLTTSLNEYKFQNSYFISKFYFKNENFGKEEKSEEDAI